MNLEDWGHYHGNSLLYDFQKKNLINTWLLPSCSLARLTVEFLFQVEESIRNFIHCCSFNTKNTKFVYSSSKQSKAMAFKYPQIYRIFFYTSSIFSYEQNAEQVLIKYHCEYVASEPSHKI